MTQTAATPEMRCCAPQTVPLPKRHHGGGKAICQLAQLAEALILDALLSPTPPKTNGKLAIGSQCKHADSKSLIKKINVRCSVHLQMGLDERSISKGFCWGKHICVPSSSPNTCIRVPQLCDTFQYFATSGPNPCPVLHLGLSTVDLECKCCCNATLCE